MPLRAGLWQRLLAPYREGLAGLDRRAYVVMLATLLSVAARMSVVTFLGIYFTRQVGLSIALVGFAFLAENLARGFAAPVAGAVSDRVGRRPVLLASILATAFVLPSFLLVRDPLTLLAWSVVLGVTQSGAWPASMALLMDLTPPARRQAVLSVNYTALAAGYTLGVLPAGYILGLGFGALAAASSLGFFSIALLVGLGLRGPMPQTRAEGPRSSLLADVGRAPRDRAFLLLAGLGVVFPIGIGLVTSVTPLYGDHEGLDEASIGVALALNGPLLALLVIPVNVRISRSGPYRFLPVAAGILAASYLVLVWGGGFGHLVGAILVFTVGELVFSSAIPTAVAILAPPGQRGAYQGAWGFVFSVGTGSALFLSGLLEGAWGWRATWLAWAGATALAGVALLLARPRLRRAADERMAAAREREAKLQDA